MEERIYTFKNIKYKLKPLTLAVLSAAAPMLAAFRKLVYKYTADIDMSEVNSAKERISELETAIRQTEENEPGTDNNRSIELNNSLDKAKRELQNNQYFQSALKLYNECSGLAMLELMGSKELITGFIENVVCSADGNGSKVHLDFSDKEAAEFVKDVVTDFFGCIAGRGRKRSG
jgi:hypothetical protein